MTSSKSEGTYDAFLNPGGDNLPKQYRFGMAGDGQDTIIERFLRLHSNGITLNLGCGISYQQQSNIGELVKKLIAGDVSESTIKQLREEQKYKTAMSFSDFGVFHEYLYGDIEFRIIDAGNLDLDSESVDIILLLGFFGVLRNRNPESQMYTSGVNFVNKVISECHRVNKPNGHLLICNNIKEPKEEYVQMVMGMGYNIIDTSIGDDIKTRTDSLGRYLLVCEK